MATSIIWKTEDLVLDDLSLTSTMLHALSLSKSVINPKNQPINHLNNDIHHVWSMFLNPPLYVSTMRSIGPICL